MDDKSFDGMRRILDSKMKELSSRGLGIERRRAEVISEEQEDIMWSKGILGTDSPQKLLDTLVYLLGLHFALRAGQEHRNLIAGYTGLFIGTTLRIKSGARTQEPESWTEQSNYNLHSNGWNQIS
jgi:hypothetical protein